MRTRNKPEGKSSRTKQQLLVKVSLPVSSRLLSVGLMDGCVRDDAGPLSMDGFYAMLNVHESYLSVLIHRDDLYTNTRYKPWLYFGE